MVGGAFYMSDTEGLPLEILMDAAESKGLVLSIPHYFASAIEHGWSDEQAFRKIREALVDRGKKDDFERVRNGCIAMFMDVASQMPSHTAEEIGRRMRLLCEEDFRNAVRNVLNNPDPCNFPPCVFPRSV